MTSLADEIMWEAPDTLLSDRLDARDDAGVELPPPPPYGYRYLDGVGYHPYVAAPNPERFWRTYALRLLDRVVPRSSGAHAKHSASADRRSLVVGLAVAAVVAVIAAVLGATSPWAGPGRSDHIAASVQRTSASRGLVPTGASTSPGPGHVGSGTPGSAPQAPAAGPVTLAPGIFTPPPSTTPGNTSTVPGRSAPTRPTTNPTKSSPGSSTSSASTSATTPSTQPTSTVPAPTNVTTPTAPPGPDAQWWAANSAQTTQMQTDASTIEAALPSVLTTGNLSQVSQSCQTFLTEVDTMSAATPIPDASLYPTWQQGLEDYQTAAQECTQGIAAQDNNLIGQASLDLSSGLGRIDSVVQVLSTAT